MRVFLSWSGQSSRQIADCFHAWIPRVIQAVEPYLSSQDIEKGERWLSSISTNLETIDFGIVIVTSANIHAPWINFEAGALSKKIDRARLIPVLFDITDADLVNHPLSQFQYVKLDKEDLLRLFRVLNQSSPKPLPEGQFEETFDLWFEKYFTLLKKIKSEKEARDKKAPVKEDADTRLQRLEGAVDELLNLQRRQARQSDWDKYSGSGYSLNSDLARNILFPEGVGKGSAVAELKTSTLNELVRLMQARERGKSDESKPSAADDKQKPSPEGKA